MPSILALQPQVNRRRTISHEHSAAGRPSTQQQKPPSSWSKVVPHARKLSLRLVRQRRPRTTESQRAGLEPNSMATADEIINVLYHPVAANSASADLRHRGELSRPPAPPEQHQPRPQTRRPHDADTGIRRHGNWDELLRAAEGRAPDAPPQRESARRAQPEVVPPNVLLADVPGNVPGNTAHRRRRRGHGRGVNRDPRAIGPDAPPAYVLMERPPSYKPLVEEVTPWMQRGESLTGELALGMGGRSELNASSA
ncbi:hypothetical protein PENSPDRAFT_667453 [Peniophora sp. CONT]|nr:hypothetical protein PENSPDRAFT_667453 [Peniophora sp. CONT]